MPPAAAEGAASLGAAVGAAADGAVVAPPVLEQAASTRLRVSSGRAALDNRMVRFSCPFLGDGDRDLYADGSGAVSRQPGLNTISQNRMRRPTRPMSASASGRRLSMTAASSASSSRGVFSVPTSPSRSV